MKLQILSFATTVAFAFSNACAGQSDVGTDGWEIGITPYLWLPGIEGKLNFDIPPGGDSPIANIDYLSHLKFAAMLTGTAQKRDWGIFYDFVYVNFGNLKSTVHDVNGPGGIISLPIAASLDSGIQGTVATLTGTRLISSSRRLQLDLIGGLRFANISTSASWNFSGPIGPLDRSGRVSNSVDIWDGLFGILGRAQLGDSGRWYLPFELDIGAGTKNSTTSNGVLGVGYKLGWGDIVLAYRYLYYNMGSDGALHDLRLAGPCLGVSFHW